MVLELLKYTFNGKLMFLYFKLPKRSDLVDERYYLVNEFNYSSLSISCVNNISLYIVEYNCHYLDADGLAIFTFPLYNINAL